VTHAVGTARRVPARDVTVHESATDILNFTFRAAAGWRADLLSLFTKQTSQYLYLTGFPSFRHACEKREQYQASGELMKLLGSYPQYVCHVLQLHVDELIA
jgi:hypothetical protein